LFPPAPQALECKQLALFISQCIKTIILVGNTLHHSFQKSLAVQQQQQQGAAPAQLPPLPEGIPAGFTEEELRALSRWAGGRQSAVSDAFMTCTQLVLQHSHEHYVATWLGCQFCTVYKCRLWINGLRCLKLVSYQNEAREVCEKFADAYW
jgi:hypothetical protein